MPMLDVYKRLDQRLEDLGLMESVLIYTYIILSIYRPSRPTVLLSCLIENSGLSHGGVIRSGELCSPALAGHEAKQEDSEWWAFAEIRFRWRRCPKLMRPWPLVGRLMGRLVPGSNDLMEELMALDSELSAMAESRGPASCTLPLSPVKRGSRRTRSPARTLMPCYQSGRPRTWRCPIAEMPSHPEIVGSGAHKAIVFNPDVVSKAFVHIVGSWRDTTDAAGYSPWLPAKRYVSTKPKTQYPNPFNSSFQQPPSRGSTSIGWDRRPVTLFRASLAISGYGHCSQSGQSENVLTSGARDGYSCPASAAYPHSRKIALLTVKLDNQCCLALDRACILLVVASTLHSRVMVVLSQNSVLWIPWVG
ncbi:hypothetical protein MUK42_06291, partial [Musa troglodytarum]